MIRPLLGLILVVFSAGHVHAQGTLLDGMAEFTRGTNAWNESIEADLKGVSFPQTADNLNQVGWAFRVLGDTRETFMPVPDLQEYELEPQSQIDWLDVDNRGLLSAKERVTLSGSVPLPGEAFDGQVQMTLELTNVDNAPVTLDVFHVLDLDVAGSPSNDSASLVLPISEPTIRFTDAQGLTGYYTGADVDAYAVRPRGFDDVHAMLADADVDNLDDGGLPAGPDDLIAAFQWGNRTLQPGETLVVDVRFSINRPTIVGELQATLSAAPNPVTRGEILQITASAFNNGETPSPGTHLLFDVDGSDVTFLSTEGCLNDPAGYPECTLGLIQPGTNAVVNLRASPGVGTPAQLPVQVSAGSSDATDVTPLDNVVTTVVSVVSPSVDLQLVKTNDVDGIAVDIDGWKWNLSLRNAATAAAPAIFETGQTLLLDQLPGEGMVYGAVAVASDASVTGTVACTIEALELRCIATSPISMPPGSAINVAFAALPPAPGSYANPRLGGVCSADPGNVQDESIENNNICANSVQALDFLLFSDGFED